MQHHRLMHRRQSQARWHCTTSPRVGHRRRPCDASRRNWCQRNSPPYALCVEIAQKKGVSLDWLIFGIGDMRLGAAATPPAETSSAQDSSTPRPAADRLSQFVYWWYVNRTQDEMIWLEQQFKRAVPEYGEWLVTQPSGG